MAELMANSKRASPRETFQCPYPCGEPRLEALQHQQVVLVQSPTGPLLLSSGSWCVQNFARTLQDCCLCFSQCSGSPIIKSHWPSRSDSKGIPSPFVTRPPEEVRVSRGLPQGQGIWVLQTWVWHTPFCILLDMWHE